MNSFLRLLKTLVKPFTKPLTKVLATPPFPKCVFPLPVLEDGRRGGVSSRGWWKNPSRPTHKGDDWMYKRLPTEMIDHSKSWIVPKGTVAIAVRDGIVYRAGILKTGYRCWIYHAGDNKQSGYFHLAKLYVKIGDHVRAGQAVGVIGDSPKDAGDPRHLHFEISVQGTYHPVDPTVYLKEAGAVHVKERKPDDQ